MDTASVFSRALGIEVPLICGAMYPCSNPELVAAVSAAGGIGIVQPLSLTYVHGYEFREGLRYIRRLTGKPIGVNLIIERSSGKYLARARQWLEIALEEQVPFIVTALGDPRWVVQCAAPAGVTVYHDVTGREHALKALDGGVDGFICVNNRAGGHAGRLSPQQLLDDLGPLGKPLICAGGIGTAAEFAQAVAMGYAGAHSSRPPSALRMTITSRPLLLPAPPISCSRRRSPASRYPSSVRPQSSAPGSTPGRWQNDCCAASAQSTGCGCCTRCNRSGS